MFFHSNVQPSLSLTEAGLILAGLTPLARFEKATGRLACEPERFGGLLTIALGQSPSARSIAGIERAATHWHAGDRALANLRLAFAGLPRLDAPQDLYRLKAAEILFDAGFTANDFAELLGLEPPSSGLDKDWRTQPRAPAGSGKESGEWIASVWSFVSDWLDGEVPVYDQDTGTQVGTQSRAQAIATSPLVVGAEGTAAFLGGEAVAAAVADAIASDAAAIDPAVPEDVAETIRTLLAANNQRGLASEARVLEEMGLVRNTRYVTSSEGRSIPDALTDTLLVEIKDAIRVTCTRQIRIQTAAALATGRQSILITGSNTRVSEQAYNAFNRVIRHFLSGTTLMMTKIEVIFPFSKKLMVGRLFEKLSPELRPSEFRLDEGKRGPSLGRPGDILKIFDKRKCGFLLHGNNIDYMFTIVERLPIMCFVELGLNPEYAVDFLVRMAAARPLFAYACRPEERNSRNQVVHDLDGGSIESWVGRDLEKYVPGLYWLTLLPSDLIAKHGIPIETLVEAAVEHRELDGGQHLFRFYEYPEDWRKTRKIDELIAANRGVFDIEKARQALVGVKGIMPAIEALSPWD